MRVSAVASISTSNNDNKHLQTIITNGNAVTINVLQASVVNLGSNLIPSSHNYGAYQDQINHQQNSSLGKQSSPRHIRASVFQATETSEQAPAPFIFSHMNGQLTFKGKRSGGGFGSSTNNQFSTSVSNVAGGSFAGGNQAMQKQLNQYEQKVVGSISPFTRGSGQQGATSSNFGGKQQRQLLNKTYKKQQAQNVLQSQSISPGNSGAYSAKNGLISFNKKTQEQQLLYVSSLQQQNSKFQELQPGQTLKSQGINKSPSSSILQVINASIVNGQTSQASDLQTHSIIAQQSSIGHLLTVPHISSPSFVPNTSNQVNPEISPKLGTQQKQSQASLRFTHSQAFQSSSHHNPTLQQKLDSILSIQQQPMQSVQREALNVSTYSNNNNNGNNNQISSSKKHRDFMKAQELSKILVAPSISKASNYQLRLKPANQDQINRSRSRDNNNNGTESAIFESEENSYQLDRNISMEQNDKSSFNMPKRNAQLPRQPSGGVQRQQALIPGAGQQIISQASINLNSAQRAGSASNPSSQQAQSGYQKQQQQTVRRGSENTQRRRESSAGSRLNGLNQAIQQANQLNPKSQQIPMTVISMQTYSQEKETTNQILQKSLTNITQQQTTTGTSTNFQQSESSLNSDLANIQQNNTNHNHRSNSLEIAGNNKYADLSEDEEAVVKSQQSGTPALNGDRGAGGCGCDSLSQVSEESAFEEDDIEEQKDNLNNALTKPQPKKVDENGDENKKKKQVTIKILASMPNNAREQEDAFFQSGFTINPVFEYDNPQVASRFISQFKKPRSELMSIATKIMDAFLAEYGSESNYFLTEGRVITDQDETEAIFQKYLEDLNVLDCALINFSDKIVAPTSVTYDNYSSKIRINIQIPIEYREGRITGVLHHEIGTHFLRRYNEIQQPWHLKRKKYGLKSCIAIEEGMGCINMMLEQSKDVAALVLGEPMSEVHIPGSKRFPFLFKPALNYYACYKASEMSFAELFNDLAKYVDNPRKRWKYVLRVKRGLGDTSLPGGLYKDQVYLEGAVKILKNRKDINFKLFYCGKINIEDIKRQKFIKKANLEGNIIPKFMEDMPQFKRNLDVIAKCNFID